MPFTEFNSAWKLAKKFDAFSFAFWCRNTKFCWCWALLNDHIIVTDIAFGIWLFTPNHMHSIEANKMNAFRLCWCVDIQFVRILSWNNKHKTNSYLHKNLSYVVFLYCFCTHKRRNKQGQSWNENVENEARFLLVSFFISFILLSVFVWMNCSIVARAYVETQVRSTHSIP